jgi:hypothetical protein
MSIIVGTNSWVTLAEANAYFASKYNAATLWATLANAVKEQLLISAYYWIQQQKAFSISPASTAAKVKQAQYEAAWFIYKYGDEYEKRRALSDEGVKSFSISKFSETLDGAQFPAFIADILDGFATGTGGKFPFVQRSFDD